MAWSGIFRKRDANSRTAWGYHFQLSADHLDPAEMDAMKFSYDVLGESALDRLNHISHKLQENVEQDRASYRDLYLLLRDHSETDDVLSQLWSDVNTVPPWVDWEQIARGQDCFYRYGGPALTGLAFQSLLGGMGGARVVETLAKTGGFSTKVARHRLFETTQYILQCTRSLESVQPGGAGHASSVRVRLLHASVRQRILKLAQQRPSYYNVQELGLPINDLDCIATIATFSAALVWISLPRQGIWMTKREVVDYIALWRYIAYLTGTPTGPFETPEKAKRAMEVLMLYEIRPTQTSRILANNIIKCLEGQPPSYASKSFLEVNSRFLNGNELSDALGLGRPGLYYWALMCGQCLFFMALCYTYRSVPFLDRRKIKALRIILWKIIVLNENGLGDETTFDFKYIPDLSKSTQMEDSPRKSAKQTCTDRQPLHFTVRGVERRNLQALAVGGLSLCLLGFIGFEVGASIVRSMASNNCPEN